MSRSRTQMTTIIIAVLLILAAIALCWYFILGRPNPPLRQTTVTFGNPATGTPAADDGSVNEPNGALPEESLTIDGARFTVEIASTALQQARGLSYRPSLGAQDGMLFVFSKPGTQTFWMKDMRFPLDMIWISGNAVAGIAANAPAPPPGTPIWQLSVYSSPSDTDKVLEVNAGIAAKYGIKVGDTVSIGSL